MNLKLKGPFAEHTLMFKVHNKKKRAPYSTRDRFAK